MGLFPQTFLDDLRSQADIVRIVQDHVQLRRSGATFKGLCPFHSEKTPSFHVNGEKGFFHCFGCSVGGDVFKFVELTEKLSFPEAVRHVAQREGVTVPEVESSEDRESKSEREALLKMHEVATAYFREGLTDATGRRARQLLETRHIEDDTIATLEVGYAPPLRDGLGSVLKRQGFNPDLMVRSGLVVEREGRLVDRFRNRLIFPIRRDTGSVVAFGGRRMTDEQQPKYINSPETPIYSKGRTLYGLNVTKGDIRQLGYAVLVEGYFDFAQALQAGITPTVATSGTALTTAQARLLKRSTTKVILSFDPDAAGQSAAARSCDLMVTEGFQVKVAVLPPGDDPDGYIQSHGPEAYAEQLRASQPYLDYLLDRTAQRYDFSDADSRLEFLTSMLTVAARVPDAAARDQFADRLAHRAQVVEEVVRAEIRRAAVDRRTTVPSPQMAAGVTVKPAERGLIWALIRDPESAVLAMDDGHFDGDDLDGLQTASVLRVALSLRDSSTASLPETLVARLSTIEADLVAQLSAGTNAPAPAAECIRALKRVRYERERAAVQREIDHLQELGATSHGEQIDALWAKKIDLSHRIEALTA